MDLRVSVVLLFVFLTGGYSLRCYFYISGGSCKAEEHACPDGFSKCATITTEHTYYMSGSTMLAMTAKGCSSQCKPGIELQDGRNVSVQCCDTDLCNAADGVYKGSFLLLFSPLLFYFLFQ